MDTLMEHIYLEFRLGTKFSIDQWHDLKESQGQVSKIDRIYKDVERFIRNCPVTNKQEVFSMEKYDFPTLEGFPFTDITIDFNLSINPQKLQTRNAFYSSESTIAHPIIKVFANAHDMDELVNQCGIELCHELIHREEDLGLLKNTGKRLDQVHKGNGYYNYVNIIKSNNNDKFITNLFKFLYWSDFAERKAFIGSLYGELKKYTNNIYDSNSAYRALYNTEAWKGYKRWENTVKFLNKINGQKELEQHILKIYKIVCKIEITRYSTFLQMINRRWNKMKHSIDKKVSKLLYRIYSNSIGFGGEIEIGEY
jgi:hypothetical protein